MLEHVCRSVQLMGCMAPMHRASGVQDSGWLPGGQWLQAWHDDHGVQVPEGVVDGWDTTQTLPLLAQAWYMNPVFSVLIGGILPFGAVFIELFFILTSMWLHQFYYLFGFLCLVFVILIITCAEITIVLCYFQLCSEDYHWWCAAFPQPGIGECRSPVLRFMPQLMYTALHVTYHRAATCTNLLSSR